MKGNSSWFRRQNPSFISGSICPTCILPPSPPPLLSSSCCHTNKPLEFLHDGSQDLLSSHCRLRGFPPRTHTCESLHILISPARIFPLRLYSRHVPVSLKDSPDSTCEKPPSLCLTSQLTLSETRCSSGSSPH